MSSDDLVFPCGHLCQDNPLMIYLTSATSAILLCYTAFLQKKRSRDRTFVIIRALLTTFLVVRIFSVIVPATTAYVATFISVRQMTLFLSVFMWHKSVVDSSWKAVKVSLTSPKWIQYFTWIQQTIIVLIFPITYSLGAHPLGNPRCSAVQAVNASYRFFMAMCLGGSLVYCNYVIHRTVATIRQQNKLSGGNEGMQRRMNKALAKIRKVSIVIFIIVLVLTYTFVSSITGDGDPVVTCNSTFGDVFGSLSSGLAAFLILWSTDSDYGPGGSSSATKSISSSTEMPKTYSEMQQEKTKYSVVSRDSGFTSGSSQSGGFASPSPRAMSPGQQQPGAGFVSSPSPRASSPQVSPRSGGFTTGPSRASTGFVNPPSRPSSRAPSRASTAAPVGGASPSVGPFQQQQPQQPMRSEEAV